MQDTSDEMGKRGYWCTRHLGGRDLGALEEGSDLASQRCAISSMCKIAHKSSAQRRSLFVPVS